VRIEVKEDAHRDRRVEHPGQSSTRRRCAKVPMPSALLLH